MCHDFHRQYIFGLAFREDWLCGVFSPGVLGKISQSPDCCDKLKQWLQHEPLRQPENARFQSTIGHWVGVAGACCLKRQSYHSQ